MADNGLKPFPPEELSDSNLKAYLRQYNQVIPRTRRELITAVSNHLRMKGRTHVLMKTPSTSAYQKVVNALSSLFRQEAQIATENHYDTPPSPENLINLNSPADLNQPAKWRRLLYLSVYWNLLAPSLPKIAFPI